MYELGQELNIGYYVGFRHEKLVKTKATVVKVSEPFVWIKIELSSGGTQTKFGTERELKELEANYNK